MKSYEEKQSWNKGAECRGWDMAGVGDRGDLLKRDIGAGAQRK